MRFRFYIVFALGLACLALLVPSAVAQKDVNDGYGGRPPAFTPAPAPSGTVEVPTPGPARPTPAPGSQSSKGSPDFMPVPLFGSNLYLTGLERDMNQVRALGIMAGQAGVRWSREELSWANIEAAGKGQFNWPPYDARLTHNTNNGIEVIGMLLTTPRWASTNPGAPDWYWYEPANYNDYYDFVRAAVNRWKHQVHTWEIWNEPNHAGTWNCVNNCNRAAHYAQLLAGAYAAVKSVDPNARVLIGGLYVHDYNNEGMSFLNQVVAASGGAIYFDGLSIHTYMPDRVPEAMRPDSVVQNFQYRLNMVNDWINAHGGLPPEIWITEDGRSTCGTCPTQFRWSEDMQASMLTRMYGIAAAMPRVVHFSQFQFEDKFNNPNDLWSGMAIVRDNYTLKPAYNAYKTASNTLTGATYTGPGPQMIPGGNPHQPDSSDYIGFDYRFVRGNQAIHLVWRVNDIVTLNYPVESSVVDVIDRDGGVTRMNATNGTIPLTVSPRPQFIVTVCQGRFSDVCSGDWSYPYIECLVTRNVMSGYADGTFRPNNPVTRGQLSKIVSNSAGFTDTPTGQTFQDVAPGSTYYVYAYRLAIRNIMGGYACGGPSEPCSPGNRPYFRPNANATRGQIAKVVSEAKGYSEPPATQTFQDVPPGSTFYVWVERLASRGFMSGYACGSVPGEPCGPGNRPYFRPGNMATRAQTSKIVANAFFPECTP